MKIRKGDTVKILKGKDKNKTGKVIQMFPQERLAVVEGMNVHVKHLRARGNNKGQRIEYPSPYALANIMVVCPSCARASRIEFQFSTDGKKQRMCKKCKSSFV